MLHTLNKLANPIRRSNPEHVIHIDARRWFDRVNGNTYHSVSVFVDGKHAFTVPFEYGYGDQWQYTALEGLEKRGLVPKGGKNEPFWQWKKRVGNVTTDVVDVTRRGDLHNGGKNAPPPEMPVIFRKARDGEIFAVFPTQAASQRPSDMMGYAHMGQHQAVSSEYVRESKPATESEYAPLLRELRSIYETHDEDRVKLVPVKRASRQMDSVRFEAIRRAY